MQNQNGLIYVLFEVVFNSDRDRFLAVVVEELSEVGFSDSESGRVALAGQFFCNFASFHFRDSAHTVEGVGVVLTVESVTEDIELLVGSFEDDGDVVEVRPTSDAVLESILVEPKAFDLVISARGVEEVIVVNDATDGIAVGGMRGRLDYGNFGA